MKNRIPDISVRKAAKVAGFALLIMLIPAIFANFFVFPSLIVPGDATTTANNIMASEGLLRAGIGSWLIVIILDLVIAWALYVLLKQANKSLSLLAAWFRLMHAAIFGITLLNLVFVLQLLSGADYLTVFETSQLHALVLLFLNGYNYGFSIGIFFFSFHLGILGYLVFKSGYIPRILGVFLIISSFAYLIINAGEILLPAYPETIALVLGVPAFIGEFLLMLWLLFKGGKIPEMNTSEE
jgi:hypothetical protein